LPKNDLYVSKCLLWIPTIDPSTVSNFVSVMFKIRDAYSSTMFLVHKISDITISFLGGYVCCNENHIECELRLVKSLLGLRLERQNQLILRHSSKILLDRANPICRHTYQEEFRIEELDRMMCQDAHACEQLCRQFCKAPRLT